VNALPKKQRVLSFDISFFLIMRIFKFTSHSSFRIAGLLLFTSLLFSVKNVYAENDQLKSLMQANNCMACHQIEKRKYGPQFNEIGSKYIGDTAAATKLAAKIKAGGSGVWGEDMMPPQPQVSDSDAKTIAELILALKPGEPKQ
jgi:cytochrome c